MIYVKQINLISEENMNSKKWLTLCVAFVMVLSLVLVAACNTHKHDYQWDYNDTEHWMVCEEDGEIDESTRAPHRLINSVCECGYMHIHSFTDWNYDNAQHWKVCPKDNAPDASSYAAHNFGDNCACICGATNHDFEYAYTADNVPAPLANGGELTATCAKCGETMTVSYDFGSAGASVVKLADDGTYYVSGDATGILTLEFDIVAAGRYMLSFKDMVFPVTAVRSLTDVLINNASIMSNGELDDTYKGKVTLSPSSQDFATLVCNFDEEDVGKTVGLKFTFLSGEAAIVPYALIEFAASEAGEVPEGLFIAHFYNTSKWDAVYIHAWVPSGDYFGGWPGQQVTEVVDGWYTLSFEVDAGSVDGATFAFIFNNGGNGAQTKDLFPTQNEVWVTVDSSMFYSAAEANAYASQLKPISGDSYFLAGVIQGQEDWSETTTNYTRVLPEEDGYSLTISLKAGDQFKIKKNVSGWDVEFGYGVLTATGENGINTTGLFFETGGYGGDIGVNQACTVTITLDLSTGRISIVVHSLD